MSHGTLMDEAKQQRLRRLSTSPTVARGVMSRTCVSTFHAHIQKTDLVQRIGPFFTTRFVLRLLDFWRVFSGYVSPVEEERGDSRHCLNESSHTFERVIVTRSLSNV